MDGSVRGEDVGVADVEAVAVVELVGRADGGPVAITVRDAEGAGGRRREPGLSSKAKPQRRVSFSLYLQVAPMLMRTVSFQFSVLLMRGTWPP